MKAINIPMWQEGRSYRPGISQWKRIVIIIHLYFCLCVCCLVHLPHMITQINVINSFHTSKQQEDLLTCRETELKWISAHNPACCVQTCLQTSTENNSRLAQLCPCKMNWTTIIILYWLRNLNMLLRILKALDHFKVFNPFKADVLIWMHTFLKYVYL